MASYAAGLRTWCALLAILSTATSASTQDQGVARSFGPFDETLVASAKSGEVYELTSPVGVIGNTQTLSDSLWIDSAPVIRTSSNGAVVSNFADPSIIDVNGVWYSFATGAKRDGTGYRIQAAASFNFQEWGYIDRDALAFTAAWVNRTSPQFWAPDVSQLDDGSFIMYYSARADNQGPHCIGAATTPSLSVPFTPYPDSLFCPTSGGGAIDASGFRDDDGTRYVVYKVDGNTLGHGGSCGNTVQPQASTPIVLQQVESDGVTPRGEPVTILDHDVGSPLVEAPSLMVKDGLYTLFFSSNCWNTPDYNVGMAVADSITGPYIKLGSLLKTGDQMPGQSNGNVLKAPGGASVAADGQHMVFHAVSGNHRSLFTAQIDTPSFGRRA